mmetsp:Transcript_8923/g.9436  ORF Transcript_8923/g.9436 Transcript_8923/m.9436 type:complete len:179 (-) Transcript_8923:180-716(-)|eukprot:CAMPEP_0174818042 /NCGR_PEP_ID=MMETSP1107-20130205/639_1 /TAXON_ID=36770 /ORGANISM="Paraphysomonas vestita, Strain GFlagA" /LENGTH=178 /DNA_ID=CAMNT_0016029349 /DNA_START=40 /DNA_END=576 /DNA_ORIENTATION=+
MSITVAEEGNRRRGDMSEDEIRQCVLDIKSWFERRTNVGLADGADRADFQRLAKAADEADPPESLHILLSVVNGSIWFLDKEAMDIEKIIETVTYLGSKRSWKGEYLPFCGDESSLLLIDTSNGKVYEWDSDDGLGDCIASSFSSYLENYRNSLLNGHMEYLGGVGVVESMSGSHSRK